jgi:hypothetical protein
MTMTGLTPEQRRLIDQAGDEPVPIEDPETSEDFVLMRRRVYDQLRQAVETKPVDDLSIPEGIRKSQEAFFRDLPELLKDRRLRGRCVAYHGDERIGIARDDEPLIRECLRRGLKREEYDILIIEPQSAEPEEIDYPSAWYEA